MYKSVMFEELCIERQNFEIEKARNDKDYMNFFAEVENEYYEFEISCYENCLLNNQRINMLELINIIKRHENYKLDNSEIRQHFIDNERKFIL